MSAAPPRGHTFGQGSLWVELQFKLPAQVLAHEFGVLADIRRDHLFHLPRLQQDADTEIINTGVVGGKDQLLRARLLDGL